MAEHNPDMAFNAMPSALPAGSPAGAAPASEYMRRLQAVLNRFEITVAEANDLVILQDYEMVVIADDSGSMNLSAAPVHMRQLGPQQHTRWQELQDTVSAIVDIAACFDPSGVDVFFLNRQPVMGVADSKQRSFVEAFAAAAKGGTPLTETLQRVAAKFEGEKKILVFILTDGEPAGGRDRFIQQVSQVVAGGKVKIQIMACTGEDDEIGWLNALDSKFTEVDVVDDFFAEKQEVIKAGLAPRFTRGDWCMKAMLGPVSRKFDSWDERLGRGKGKAGPDCPIPGCGNDPCTVM